MTESYSIIVALNRPLSKENHYHAQTMNDKNSIWTSNLNWVL